jgi:hypothetical protein
MHAFTYDASAYSNEFATKLHIQDVAVGDYVALVLNMVSAETKETQTKQEPYLQVSGVDMDGAPVNYLRRGGSKMEISRRDAPTL